MSHLVIRADSSPDIGMGHVMRCLALAQAWRDKGRPVTFMSCGDDGALRRRAASNGCRFIPLEARHPDPTDLTATLELLSAVAIDGHEEALPWLVTDGYFFSPSYHAAVRAAGIPLLVIDDVADQPVYHADVLLNQNIDSEQFDYRYDRDTTLLLGTKYALLRREFDAGQGNPGQTPTTVRRVLVTAGGGDSHNVTLRALRALRRSNHSPQQVVIVVGASNPHGPVLEREIGSLPNSHVRLAYDVEDMAELMGWAELAISGAGSTCWELAAMRVPSLLLVLAENQRGIAEGLHRVGAAVSLGWHEQVTDAVLAAGIDSLCADRHRRERIRSRAQGLVDGQGAKRVVAAMRVHKKSEAHL
jgi:UDP-2,4-diacetamido-2,4,6-trideoxy-beta-L-altropyranose hydrolase